MKASLSKVKMFIIDEVFMVSSLNLAYMHLRAKVMKCFVKLFFNAFLSNENTVDL